MHITSFRTRLGGIVFLALIVRCGYVLLFKQEIFTGAPEELWSGDQIYYSGQAKWLADGFGFQWRYRAPLGLFETPAADHPPLTAILMTPASMLGEGFLLPQRYAMALLGTFTVGCIGVLGKRVGGIRVGLIAAFLAAIYPNFWLNDGVIMAEGPTVLMTTLFLLAIYHFLRKPRLSTAALTGLLAGLAALGRAEMALLVPLVILPVVIGITRNRTRPSGEHNTNDAEANGLFASSPTVVPSAVKLFAVAAGVSLLTVAPWVIPNLFRFEEPVLMSTNDGLTILGANCDPAYDGGGVGFWHFGCAVQYDDELVGMDQSQRSSFLRAKGFEYMGDNLDRLPGVMVTRVGRLWSVYQPKAMTRLNTGEGREPQASEAARFMLYPLVLLAIAGAVLMRRAGRDRVWPLVSLTVLVTIVGALFYGIVRFRAPAEITLVVLAAFALSAVFDARPGPRGGPINDSNEAVVADAPMAREHAVVGAETGSALKPNGFADSTQPALDLASE